MAKESQGNNSIGDIFNKVIKPFDDPSENVDKVVQLCALLATLTFLVISLTTNVYVIGNILCRGKKQVSYFKIFLVLSLVHITFSLCTSLTFTLRIFQPLIPDQEFIQALQKIIVFGDPVSRACLGICFLLVAGLNIERFLASTIKNQTIRSSTNLLALVISISGPVVVVAFYVVLWREEKMGQSWEEFWFGVEICVYIICPLLVLTIFGTVNYCKVSLTSRILPTVQIQAIKLNIGVTILTNIAIFLFLVQKCLLIWLFQIEERSLHDDSEDLTDVMNIIEIAQTTTGVMTCLVMSLVPLLFCCVCSDCCVDCCCPAINQLEEPKYSQVNKDDTLRV